MTKRLKSLDIVRGCAALSVFAYHLSSPAISDNFEAAMFRGFFKIFENLIGINTGIHPGVLVFIVLSGFCIHMPLSRECSNEYSIRWSKYFKRRFIRIYPVLLAAMIIGCISTVVIDGRMESQAMISNIIESMLLLPGLIPVGLEGPPGNEPLITVIIECLLYIIYPLGLIVLRRKGWKYVLACCLGIYFLDLLLIFAGVKTSWIIRNVYSFLLFWWLGAFAVDYAKKNKALAARFFKVRYTLVLYLIYLIFSHLAGFRGAHYFGNILLAFAAAHLLGVLYLKDRCPDSKQNLFVDIFSYVGMVSYSLYAIHVPVLRIVKHYVSVSSTHLLHIFIVAVATVVFYYCIENPFHNIAIKYSGPSLKKGQC